MSEKEKMKKMSEIIKKEIFLCRFVNFKRSNEVFQK